MRGQIPSQPSFVSLINVETLIGADHPIRLIKRLARCAAQGQNRPMRPGPVPPGKSAFVFSAFSVVK